MVPIAELLADAESHPRKFGRPLVTLSYAQSLDGSIAARRGRPLPLSGPQSMELTHRLRAAHRGILVGIGTVLADDPRLNVRLVEGEDPQPIVLDSHLRFPLGANLLQNPENKPWIATTEFADPGKQLSLEAAGARLLRFPADEQGQPAIPSLLRYLAQAGLYSLMVEGGAKIITAFLELQLVDLVILTIAPVFVGGLSSLETHLTPQPRLDEIDYDSLGDDLVIWGKPVWQQIENPVDETLSNKR